MENSNAVLYDRGLLVDWRQQKKATLAFGKFLCCQPGISDERGLGY
jgi:hypothetical protein